MACRTRRRGDRQVRLRLAAQALAEIARAGRSLLEQMKRLAVGAERPAVRGGQVRAPDELVPPAAEMAAHALITVVDELAQRSVVRGAVIESADSSTPRKRLSTRRGPFSVVI